MTDARLEEIRKRQRTINEMVPLMYATEDQGGVPGLGTVSGVIPGSNSGPHLVASARVDKSTSPKNTTFARWIADSPRIVAELLEEIDYLRGQLTDLCIDSQAASEVTRMRGLLDRVSQMADQIEDDLRLHGHVPGSVDSLIDLLANALGGASK